MAKRTAKPQPPRIRNAARMSASPNQLQAKLLVSRRVRARNLSEVGCAQGGARSPESRRVREVERLVAELGAQPFADRKLFVCGKVPVKEAALAHDVAPCIACG